MARFSWSGAAALALALLTALAPFEIFPVCTAAMKTAAGASVPMKCFWTARAVLADAAFAGLAGILLCFLRQPAARRAVGALLALAGLLVVLTPAWLIGVCAGETMPCRMGTAPALYLLGGLAFVTGLCAAAAAGRDSGPGRRP